MRATYRFILLLAAAIFLAMAPCSAQDSPSLGDVARQTRQKQQAKPDPAKNAKPSRVITNDEIAGHPTAATATTAVANNEENLSDTASSGNGEKTPDGTKLPAEHWKSQIQAQKSQIVSLRQQVDEMNESIHFAPGNCVANCAQWNERQKEKQQQVERMQAQLVDQQKRLEDMQESARKQGYGSSVYDP